MTLPVIPLRYASLKLNMKIEALSLTPRFNEVRRRLTRELPITPDYAGHEEASAVCEEARAPCRRRTDRPRLFTHLPVEVRLVATTAGQARPDADGVRCPVSIHWREHSSVTETRPAWLRLRRGV